MLRRFSSHPTDAVDDVDDAGPDDPTVFQASEDDTREEHRHNPNAGKMLGTVIAVAMLGAIVVGGVQWIERERDVVPDPVSWTRSLPQTGLPAISHFGTAISLSPQQPITDHVYPPCLMAGVQWRWCFRIK